MFKLGIKTLQAVLIQFLHYLISSIKISHKLNFIKIKKIYFDLYLNNYL